MRILLTAYGPFRDIKENIGGRVLDEIQKNWDDSTGALTTLKLPVEWQSAEAALTRTLTEFKPDVVVSLGHAEKYPAITVETRYFNIAEGEDNRGETRDGEVISLGAKAFYNTNVNINELARHLTENNIQAVLHSGKEGMSYLCNFTGYLVMRHASSRRKKKLLFLFLHLPPNIMPFPTLVKGVREVINFLVSETQS